MVWVIEEHERAALQQVSRNTFRDDVIAHARRKMVFNQDISDEDYRRLADWIYDKVERFLARYDTASYDSHVMMMLVYFLRGIDETEAVHMQATLQNDRFHINTRVRIAYELCKVFHGKGL